MFLIRFFVKADIEQTKKFPFYVLDYSIYKSFNDVWL